MGKAQYLADTMSTRKQTSPCALNVHKINKQYYVFEIFLMYVAYMYTTSELTGFTLAEKYNFHLYLSNMTVTSPFPSPKPHLCDLHEECQSGIRAKRKGSKQFLSSVAVKLIPVTNICYQTGQRIFQIFVIKEYFFSSFNSKTK